MKRACYCRKPEGLEIRHLKSIRKDGYIDTEPIKELDGKFYDSLNDVILSANLLGYGIVGSLTEIENNLKSKIYEQKCGNNMMDIDDL